MKTETVAIINKLGLHARASSRLVNLTKTFGADIRLATEGQAPIDAKSIMAVMTLAAAQGTELTLTCEGRDEAAAFEAVRDLIADRFGEPE